MSRLSRRRFLGASTAAAGAYVLTKSTDAGSAQDTRIDHAKIHPAIGIARIGNSPDGYFLGPEVVEPEFTAAKDMRDRNGGMKRQAARFRIYGYNAAGQAVRELTASEAAITWQVHLANKKAEWFRFIAAMDLAESHTLKCIRRNKGIERKKLVIDPGVKFIKGKNANAVRLDGGLFKDVPVNLGELRTDEDGRLLVLGGTGKSESIPRNMPPYNPADPDTFNNADGWYDDTGDGPVRATVQFEGRELKVTSAWVVVAPPNYAPDVIGWRTLYDLLVDTYVEANQRALPTRTSFTHDVLPILRRLSGLQWVNQGFEKAFGRNDIMNLTPPDAEACKQSTLPPAAQKACRLDFDNPTHIAKLAEKNPPPSSAGFRQNILRRFRTATANQQNKSLWPMIYGDAIDPLSASDVANLAVSKTRAEHLRRWAAGTYEDDWNVVPESPVRLISKLLPYEQPAMLDRAALHFCLADAFHPGCELTWPMRHISMYHPDTRHNPFRIRERLAGETAPPHEEQLIQSNFKKYLGAQGPGDLTKWMAVPWQGDTIFCRSGYDPEFDPYIPTYWPARVPNQVLSEADYTIVMNTGLPLDQRLSAYQRRKFWSRSITGNAPEQIHQMVGDFATLGIIEARPGINNDPNFPAVMMVESLPPGTIDKELAPRVGSRSRALPHELNDPVSQAGWESPDQLEEFRRMRGIRRR